jgi:type I restriction enzyme S subunit
LPLPPLAEQSRIVARVDELMRLCDALEAKGRLEAEQHARLLGTLLSTLTDSSTPEELAANWQRVADHFGLLLDRPEAVDALEQTILQLAVRGLLVPQVSSDQPASSLLEQIRINGAQKKSKRGKVGAVASEVQPDEVPFEVPELWAWSRFGQVADIASDLVSPTGHGSEWQVAPDCIEKGTGQLLAKRTVADADVKSVNHRFHPGQIIYSKIRPSLSKAVIVDFAGLCSADMYPINSKISTQYLLLVILSRCFLDQVAAAENRVKMPKLNQEALTGFLVPVPPLAEQERIIARVTDLRRLCTDLRQCLSRSIGTQAALAEALIDQGLAA